MKILLLMIASAFVSEPSRACTVAEIGSNGNVATGQNLGWFWQIDAGLVVNKRGMAKFGLPPGPSDTPLHWVSKYGSISINPLGRELPLGGMNEKGLSVQGLHSYDGRFETTSNLPALNQFQWVQYQLDTARTVAEAIANAKAVRPTDNPQLTLHYFVCEASGKCVLFQWLQGKLEIREDLPVKAYSNTDYLTSLNAFESCAKDTCPLPDDGPNFSLQRFVRAARLVAAYDGSRDPVEYLFGLLDQVKQPVPLASWSIVTRNSGSTISLSQPGSKAVQMVDLNDYDFSCATPAKMQLVDISRSGNVRDYFQDYDVNLQAKLVAGSKAGPAQQQILREYPDKTICVQP